ncbi:helix-turn-helix transcriptional regulator [Isoptericola halotolerans]|uniref:LuxR C-terminal-related transcriptional regulator n=1 Tax=Isoptericola halotolerans TaxID=300560 RepID=UPI00389013C5
MTSYRPAAALALLDTGRGPVAPHVAVRLSRTLGGDPPALAQVAAVLRPEHLAGLALLPDPLPAVPATRAGLDPAPLGDDDRWALLCAAVAVTDRADVLLQAVGPAAEALVVGSAAAGVEVVAGRARVTDARLRCVVHDDADLGARTAAHSALARSARDLGEPEVALWHTALGTVVGDELLADGLVELAAALTARGDMEAAHQVAREAASHATGARRARAFLAAGRAALWSGHLADADDWLRRAAGSDVPTVARAAEHCAAAVWTLRAGSAVEGAEQAVVRATGPGARLARLVEPLVHLPATRADRAAMSAVVGCLSLLDVDGAGAESLLARAVLAATPARSRPGPWPRSAGALSPLAEAHVRVTQALLLLHGTEAEAAAAVLDDAAARLPVTHVAGGLAAVVARRLDELGARTTRTTAALEAAGPREPAGPSAASAVARSGRAARGGAAVRTCGSLLAAVTARDRPGQSSGASDGDPTPSAGWSAALTEREAEVARLVTSGMTNREVAAALCVSVRTVEVHLSRVFRKLDVRSRSELVVLALAPARSGPTAVDRAGRYG